jgi:hypothetical protein
MKYFFEQFAQNNKIIIDRLVNLGHEFDVKIKISQKPSLQIFRFRPLAFYRVQPKIL